MPKVFVIADTHFYHGNIINYENRPFNSIDDMNKKIINNWNQIVSKNDKVFHLGDVSFGNKDETKDIIQRLNGNKTLIIGNHDKSNLKYWLDIGFNDVSKYPIIYKDFLIMSHEPPEYFQKDTPYTYLYGHVHSTPMYKTITQNTACVSIERWGYKPVDIEKIFDLMKLSSF